MGAEATATSGDGAKSVPPEGFEEFFRHYEPMICRYLTWREAERSLVEEAAQLTLISALRYWGKVGGMTDPRGWLFLVAGQRLEDVRHDRMRMGIPTDPHSLRHAPVDNDQLSDCDQRMDIVAAVRKLPPRQQEALALRVQSGFSYQEIATSMGCAPATVRGHVHEARKSLATMLDIELPAGGAE